MSHLTAPMPPQAGPHHHQKPYLFDLPRPAHPLTPPDTDYETLSHQAPPAQNNIGLETESLPPQMPNSVFDSPFASPYATLHRKRPSVTYVSSGIRESRERVVQRGLKWLVVVVPPVSFAREHGHLGHTLSSGPARRLSSGILLPLYPTLNSQLGAIAREFSFPSISGLCVYLHTAHGGVPLTPRVSDDTWPLLWSHLFDARTPSLPAAQLPISGQIEFDIDLAKARWYDSWLASSRREYVDVPQSVAPSRPQSLSHWRADSNGSITEPVDDQTDIISLAPQPTTRAQGRNIKKLSLLDRFDGASVRSGSKLVPRDDSPPSQSARQNIVLQALSPIIQEDEPMTAKKDIDNRVNSWRMSATAAARSPLAATGQTSLDPANMPNTIEDLPTGSGEEFELNLADYTWSISSAGPPDYDLESVYSWDAVPSVHMDRRGEGSVCLTASYCTSFGPDDDYEPFSPTNALSRLPSPDIAWRMLEDVPPTPTTATSWGAPLSFPPSPAAYSYAPSVDIAGRHMSSRPVTPTTATSWGAPLSFPPSPIASSYAPSVDIAGRFLSSRPVTPTTATSWGAPLSYPPSPVLLSRAPSPDLGWRAFDSAPNSPRFSRAASARQQYTMVFPYYDAQRASTWQHVWPYTDRHQGQEEARTSQFTFPRQRIERETPGEILGYPVMDIYPAVYPSFDIYPALLTLDDRKLGAPAVTRGAPYPVFDLYPAIYPSLNVYPAALTVSQSQSKELSTRLPVSYPTVEPYPDAYPYLTVYPAVSKRARIVAITSPTKDAPAAAISVHLTPGYPGFDIYPAVYPYSLEDIYPGIETSTKSASSVITISLQTSYPNLVIYPSVYPYSLDKIYPSVVAEKYAASRTSVISVGVEWQYPIFDIYPASAVVARKQVAREVAGSLRKAYPIIDIYPAVYPWSVYEIYPSVSQRDDGAKSSGLVVRLDSHYPVFNIYPATYPYSMEAIYPVVASPAVKKALLSRSTHAPVSSPRSVYVELRAAYPNVCPYPPAYPHFAIYPATVSDAPAGILVKLTGKTAVSDYPHLVIYAPVYPHFDLYPSAAAEVPASINVELSGKDTVVSQYPHMVIYPPVYPHLDLYPVAAAGVADSIDVALSGKIAAVSQYPHLVIYPCVYPFIEVYPSAWGHAMGPASHVPAKQVSMRRRPTFSHMQLHAQVFAQAHIQSSGRERRRPKFTHQELHEQVLAQAFIPTRAPPPKPHHISAQQPAPVRPPPPVPPVPSFVPVRAPSPMRAPSPPRSRSPARARSPVRAASPDRAPVPLSAFASAPLPPAAPRRPSRMNLREEEEEDLSMSHMQVPTIVAVEPSPTSSGIDPFSPVLFEMVTAPAPVSAPAEPSLVRSRSRSGTVSSHAAAPPSTPPRTVGARPMSTYQPPSTELPPVPSAQRSLNRLSGLPAHPAVNRRMSSAAPRPMSTFGPLPAVPAGAAPAPAVSPVVLRRQKSMMSPLAEEGPSPIKGRSPQLPSPPDDLQRGFRTPTDVSSPVSPLVAMRSAELSRSRTLPTRTAPRGPRGSTLISERAKAFDNPNVVPNDDGPLKLMLAEFPAPPRPSLPSASSPSTQSQSPVQPRPVSKLDRSKYPYA